VRVGRRLRRAETQGLRGRLSRRPFCETNIRRRPSRPASGVRGNYAKRYAREHDLLT